MPSRIVADGFDRRFQTHEATADGLDNATSGARSCTRNAVDPCRMTLTHLRRGFPVLRRPVVVITPYPLGGRKRKSGIIAALNRAPSRADRTNLVYARACTCAATRTSSVVAGCAAAGPSPIGVARARFWQKAHLATIPDVPFGDAHQREQVAVQRGRLRAANCRSVIGGNAPRSLRSCSLAAR
jgi:hypothetical protein